MHVAMARCFKPYAVQLLVEAEGVLAAEELERTMDAVCAANPCVCWRVRGNHWEEGERPRIRSAASLELAAKDRLDPGERPCELVVGPGGLLFRSSHALMDGGGLMFWAAEFFRALRGEVLQGTHTFVSDFRFLLVHGKPGRETILFRNGRPFQAGEGFTWYVKSAPAGDHGFVAKAIAGLCREKGGQFMVPVDMRRFGDVRTTMNMTNMLVVTVEAGASWEEIQCLLLEEMRRGSALQRHWSDRLMYVLPMGSIARTIRRLHARAVRRNRYSFSAVISHLGGVSLADFSAPGFATKRIRPVPLDGPTSGLCLASLESESGLELSLSVPGPYDAAAEAWLEGLCGTHEIKGPEKPIDGDVYGQFLRAVDRWPEEAAVIHGEVRVSYRELERRAAEFHGAIRERGVRVGERVAVLLPHSPELLVAILGLVRGGNPFVPLDPAWPEARIRKVVADCGARLVIRGDIPGAPSSPPPETTELAYLIYTSGSMGEPKGVKVSRRSLLNFLLWAGEEFGNGVSLPLFGSISFDATLIAVFVPLMGGGTVWIPRERDLAGAAREILTSPVDMMNLTPSHLRLFLEHGFQGSAIRRLIVGGESFPTELARRVLEQRSMSIFNVYGPTEATIGCVMHEFDPEKDTEATLPIGLPIRNTRAVLRGGELWLGGACLAEGYEGRPAFGELYETGDRVTWDGGKLHYLGRSDDQVKVRGQRIEPSEVEAAILGSGLVSACAVRAENNQLAAFLVWGGEEDVPRLRESLERLLPKGWIPDRFHGLSELPFNANGKVDRKALAADFPVRENVVAASAMEMELVAMAIEIMDSPARSIVPDRPLHEAGFDSLQLLLLLTRACRRYRPEARDFGFLGPEFHREPTISSLARALGDGQKGA